MTAQFEKQAKELATSPTAITEASSPLLQFCLEIERILR